MKHIDIKLVLISAFASALPLFGVLITEAPLLWVVSVFMVNLGLLAVCKALRFKTLAVVLILSSELLFFTLNASYLLSYYLQNTGFNQAFFYHLDTNLRYGGISEHLTLILSLTAYLVLLIALKAWYVSRRQNFSQIPFRPSAYLVTLMTGFVLFSPLHSLLNYAKEIVPLSAQAYPVYENAGITASILEDLHRRPHLLEEPSEKPNIVLIYLESVEQKYFDEKIFPGLLPNLKSLKSRSVDFPHVAQAPRAEWTVGGIEASQCGYPLKAPLNTSGNNYGMVKDFMKQAVCLGDIMSSAGYHMVFMGGADARFGGKDRFLSSHGYAEIMDKRVMENLLPDPDYMHDWGLYDDSLFDLAYNKFVELSQKNEPFNLTLLTLDTHHTNGFLSRSCSKYPELDNEILDSVHCTDKLATQFISKIRASKFSPNTIIVVLSDHVALRNTAWSLLNESPNPRYLTFFVNFHGERSATYDSLGSHYDIAPTIMDMLGFDIEGQYGLGRTLMNQDGYLYQKLGRDASPEHISALVLGHDVMSYVDGLWQLETPSLLDASLVIDPSELLVVIGNSSFSFSSDGYDNPAPIIFRFDKQSLKLLEIEAFPFGDAMNKKKLSGEVLSSDDMLVLAISEAKYLKGLVKELPPDKLSLFIGLPQSPVYISSGLDSKVTLSSEDIKRISTSQTRDEVLLLRRKIVTSLYDAENAEKRLKLFEQLSRN